MARLRTRSLSLRSLRCTLSQTRSMLAYSDSSWSSARTCPAPAARQCQLHDSRHFHSQAFRETPEPASGGYSAPYDSSYPSDFTAGLLISIS